MWKEADKADRDITVAIFLAFRLPNSKITLLKLSSNIPCLENAGT
jgi:hypothetical protein